jgi:hypothetical protein
MHKNRRRKSPLLFAMAPAVLLFVAACSSAEDRGARPSAPDAPREITAKSIGGSSGVGPKVVSDSKALPEGGKYSPQKVALRDRVLVINHVTSQSSDGQSVAIDLDLSVQNTGDNDIKNEATFFRLIGSEGDIFGKQSNASGGFYGTIDARKSRRGAISFKVPEAATATLRLLYRPEVAAEAAIIPLKLG